MHGHGKHSLYSLVYLQLMLFNYRVT